MINAIEAGARALARTFGKHWFGVNGIATKHKMTLDFVNGSDAWQAESKACIEAAISSGELIPVGPVTGFLKAWDSLPVGYHSPEEVNDWLNSRTMKSGIVNLRKIAKQK